MATHATTLVSSDHESIRDLQDTVRPIDWLLNHALTLLDGQSYIAYILWPLPVGVASIGDVGHLDFGTYIQGAGSAHALTVEIREEIGGIVRHSTLGRRKRLHGRKPSVEIKVRQTNVRVFRNEVFDAAEAGAIFFHYYRNGTVPPEYELRPILLPD